MHNLMFAVVWHLAHPNNWSGSDGRNYLPFNKTVDDPGPQKMARVALDKVIELRQRMEFERDYISHTEENGVIRIQMANGQAIIKNEHGFILEALKIAIEKAGDRELKYEETPERAWRMGPIALRTMKDFAPGGKYYILRDRQKKREENKY